MTVTDTDLDRISLDELVPLEQVAAESGVPSATLRQWRSRGGTMDKGPRSIKIGPAVAYRRSDVDAWLETRRG